MVLAESMKRRRSDPVYFFAFYGVMELLSSMFFRCSQSRIDLSFSTQHHPSMSEPTALVMIVLAASGIHSLSTGRGLSSSTTVGVDGQQTSPHSVVIDLDAHSTSTPFFADLLPHHHRVLSPRAEV